MGFIQCQVPILPVLSMEDTLAFYRDALGFEVAWVWEDNGYAAIRCGDIELHLDVQPSFTPYRAHSYFFVDHIDDVYAEYKSKGVDIAHHLELKPWGVREFMFRDVNGHLFRVAEQAS